jgi:hypothetical protein
MKSLIQSALREMIPEELEDPRRAYALLFGLSPEGERSMPRTFIDVATVIARQELPPEKREGFVRACRLVIPILPSDQLENVRWLAAVAPKIRAAARSLRRGELREWLRLQSGAPGRN